MSNSHLIFPGKLCRSKLKNDQNFKWNKLQNQRGQGGTTTTKSLVLVDSAARNNNSGSTRYEDARRIINQVLLLKQSDLLFGQICIMV